MLGGQGRAAAGQGRGPKSAALRSMLAVGEDNEEDAMGWGNHNDYFEVDDGKNETADIGAGAAAVLQYQRAASCFCCCVSCCAVWSSACTMHNDDRCIMHQRSLFLNMRRWPSGWLVAGEMCLNGTQFLK